MRCGICGNEGDGFTMFVHYTEKGTTVHERMHVCRTCVLTLYTIRGCIEDAQRFMEVTECTTH